MPDNDDIGIYTPRSRRELTRRGDITTQLQGVDYCIPEAAKARALEAVTQVQEATTTEPEPPALVVLEILSKEVNPEVVQQFMDNFAGVSKTSFSKLIEQLRTALQQYRDEDGNIHIIIKVTRTGERFESVLDPQTKQWHPPFVPPGTIW